MQSRSIRIHLATQLLELWEGCKLLFFASVSTSARGPGHEAGSLKTPVGHFVIAEKIGDGEPPGTIFRDRQPTGELADPASSEDQITSRILWLDGLEEHNRNTRERYIYIHGTNQEALLGTPCSHGCIRVAQDEMVDLFSLVEAGTPVWIG